MTTILRSKLSACDVVETGASHKNESLLDMIVEGGVYTGNTYLVPGTA